MLIREILSHNPRFCTLETPVEEIARILVQSGSSNIAVLLSDQPSRPIGIVNVAEILYARLSRDTGAAGLTAADCMVVSGEKISERVSLEECSRIFQDSGLNSAFVVDDLGRCRGVVTRKEVSDALEATRWGEGDLDHTDTSFGVPALRGRRFRRSD